MTPLAFLGVLHGMFVIGTLLVVIPYYLVRPEADYLLMVILSYCLMIVSTVHSAAFMSPPAWKVFVIVAAWLLGDIGMWHLIMEKRRRH